jgi:hypothetical protein
MKYVVAPTFEEAVTEMTAKGYKRSEWTYVAGLYRVQGLRIYVEDIIIVNYDRLDSSKLRIIESLKVHTSKFQSPRRN